MIGMTGFPAGVHDLPAAGCLAPGLRHTLSVTPHHQWLPHRWHNHHQPVSGLLMLSCCIVSFPTLLPQPLAALSWSFPLLDTLPPGHFPPPLPKSPNPTPPLVHPLAFAACIDQADQHFY